LHIPASEEGIIPPIRKCSFVSRLARLEAVSSEVFVDATHVKARANNKKMQKRIAHQEALFYEEMLRKEINSDRENHGKKPLKDKDNDHKPGNGGGDKFEDYTDDVPLDEKTIKCSTTV